MVYLKYAPMAATFAVFITLAFIGYSATGSGLLLLLGLGAALLAGSWVAKLVNPRLAHAELRQRLKRARK